MTDDYPAHRRSSPETLTHTIARCMKTIELQPDNAAAYNDLGAALQDKGDPGAAQRCYRKAVELDPDNAAAWGNLATLLLEEGRADEAIDCFRQALRRAPDNAGAYNNLGLALLQGGMIDEAMTAYCKAIELKPGSPAGHLNKGGLLQECGRLEEAAGCFRKALACDPQSAMAYINLGNVLKDDRQTAEALQCYQKALDIEPDNAYAHWNLALALLLTGNFPEGWKEYEWRRKTGDIRKQRAFRQPQWKGEALQDRTILLHAEQGLGDTIQFIRYVPLVAAQGAQVVVECHKELVSLVGNVEGVQRAVARGERLPEFDMQCPLLTLPLVLGTTTETIPARVPYIAPDPSLLDNWGEKVRHDGSPLKVGLVWAGKMEHRHLRYRSCSLETLAPLGRLPGVSFYSLQKGEAAAQAKTPPEGMRLLDYTDDISDFSDTAALTAHLDLVLSIDTSVAHLAGAMGKEVWTLLPYELDWRWMIDREDSPWYPTMRLFRQPCHGDWQSVVDRVKVELESLRLRLSR